MEGRGETDGMGSYIWAAGEVEGRGEIDDMGTRHELLAHMMLMIGGMIGGAYTAVPVRTCRREEPA